MRHTPFVAAGAGIYLFSAAVGYLGSPLFRQVAGAQGPPPVVVEPGAVPLPAPDVSQWDTQLPIPAATPGVTNPAVSNQVPHFPPEVLALPPAPPANGVPPARPQQMVPPSEAVRAPQSVPPMHFAPATAPPGWGICLTCGGPAASWVEGALGRVGFCKDHLSRSEPEPPVPAFEPPVPLPAPAPTPTPAPAPAPKPAAASETVQCAGVTKAGQQCRRKIRDPSGYCHQHRPR
jgi:hypothetical protein